MEPGIDGFSGVILLLGELALDLEDGPREASLSVEESFSTAISLLQNLFSGADVVTKSYSL